MNSRLATSKRNEHDYLVSRCRSTMDGAFRFFSPANHGAIPPMERDLIFPRTLHLTSHCGVKSYAKRKSA